ncbi:MAG: polymer-forming cytoskeletal protein [Woeseiaceae bacterium]
MSPENIAAAEQQLPVAEQPEPVVIDCDLVMKGELSFAEDTDLLVTGSIDSASISGVKNLSIGVFGSLSGFVQSTTAEIAGELRGHAEIAETAIVRRTANLRGELSAKCVRVEAGANLEGCILSGTIRRA